MSQLHIDVLYVLQGMRLSNDNGNVRELSAMEDVQSQIGHVKISNLQSRKIEPQTFDGREMLPHLHCLLQLKLHLTRCSSRLQQSSSRCVQQQLLCMVHFQTCVFPVPGLQQHVPQSKRIWKGHLQHKQQCSSHSQDIALQPISGTLIFLIIPVF